MTLMSNSFLNAYIVTLKHLNLKCILMLETHLLPYIFCNLKIYRICIFSLTFFFQVHFSLLTNYINYGFCLNTIFIYLFLKKQTVLVLTILYDSNALILYIIIYYKISQPGKIGRGSFESAPEMFSVAFHVFS